MLDLQCSPVVTVFSCALTTQNGLSFLVGANRKAFMLVFQHPIRIRSTVAACLGRHILLCNEQAFLVIGDRNSTRISFVIYSHGHTFLLRCVWM